MAIGRDQTTTLIEALVSLLRTSKLVLAHSASGTPLILLRLVRDADLRLGDLAERLAVTPSSASRAVAALERDGYVERVTDPDDARAFRVRLTAAGAEHLRVCEEAVCEQLEQIFSGWSAEEGEQAVGVLRHLQLRMREFLGDVDPDPPVPEPSVTHHTTTEREETTV